MSNPSSSQPPDFSLIQGGPLYQLFVRGRLLRPPVQLLGRRIIAIVVVTWLPLLGLTILAGTATGGVTVPFLFDLEAQLRFLIAAPLLIIAEIPVHYHFRRIVGQFLARGIIDTHEKKQFDDIIASVAKARDSIVAELAILALAVASYWLWLNRLTIHADTWYASTANGRTLTLAGWWYAAVSLTVLRFLLYRWCYRLVIWWWFLWRVSRLKLHLDPLHPDRAGGLEFLSLSTLALTPILVAMTVLQAGLAGNRIWHAGMTLPQFKLDFIGMVVLLLLLVLGPLLMFAPKMARAKREGLYRFGPFASRYVDDFSKRWLSESAAHDQPLLGTPDIQSLADLANSYEVVQNMRVLPFGGRIIVQLAIVITLPLAPLVLTMVPLEQLIDRLVGTLL